MPGAGASRAGTILYVGPVSEPGLGIRPDPLLCRLCLGALPGVVKTPWYLLPLEVTARSQLQSLTGVLIFLGLRLWPWSQGRACRHPCPILH